MQSSIFLFRGKKEVAVMLLQNGANPAYKNNNGMVYTGVLLGLIFTWARKSVS
jgi:hypothetical protein